MSTSVRPGSGTAFPSVLWLVCAGVAAALVAGLTANPIGPSANAAMRYAKSGKPQVVAADLASADRARGAEAKFECGARVWRRTVVVYITLSAYLPSASLSEKVFFVGRFEHGYRVWQAVH